MFDGPSTAPPRIGAYQVVEALAPSTWRALHPEHGECVITVRRGPEGLALLERRRDQLQRLVRGSLPRPVELFPMEGGTCLVTSYLPGMPLAASEPGALRSDPAGALSVGVDLLAIVHHVHRHGVVHGRIDASHVLVGPEVGLLGLGAPPRGADAHRDRVAVAGLLYELVTGEPWTLVAPPASYFDPRLGRAFDDWLAGVVSDEERSFDCIQAMRERLVAVRATMPAPRRQRRVSGVRAPSEGPTESIRPEPHEPSPVSGARTA